MPKNKHHDTAALRAALPVAEYCARVGIELKRSGAELRGICPFCGGTTRNPFCVRDEGWNCVQCHENGDVITLCSLFEDITKGAAITRVAELTGISADESVQRGPVAKAERKAKRAEQALDRARATAKAPEYWTSCERTSETGRAYLKSRGVDAVHVEVKYRHRIDSATNEIVRSSICIPLRAANGTIINVVRRIFHGLRPNAPKTPSLKDCTTLGTFGDLSQANLTTGPVIVVEGVFDYLSARVLVPSALIIGAHGAGRWPDVVKMASLVALARGLILVPHLTDMNKIGAKKVTEAIDVARAAGVTDIRRFDLASGDLNDFLMSGGTGADLLDAPLVADSTRWEYTEWGTAHRYGDLNRERLRFFPSGGDSAWMAWLGSIWQQTVQACEPVTALDRVLESLRAEAAEGNHTAADEVKAMQTSRRISSMVRLAKAAPGMTARRDEFDTSDMLLTVPNGTIDLSTGELLEHNREHMITVSSPVAFDPDARAPRWEKFLDEVFEPNPDGAEFLARYAGYSLTARNEAQCLLFAHGQEGRNGKGVAFRAIQGILGRQLAGGLPMEMLVRRKGVPSKVNPYYAYARVARCRALFLSETSKGDEIDPAIVKSLTGGDMVSARAPAEKGWDYIPRWKLYLAGNNLPAADADDEAFWSRILILPFHVSFRNRRDDTLDQVLKSEYPGILAWAVRGCLEWQRRGAGIKGLLDGAESVTRAVKAYRSDSDDLGDFLAANVAANDGQFPYAKASTLYQRYRTWTKTQGGETLAARAYHKEMERRGHRRHKKSGIDVYASLALRSR